MTVGSLFAGIGGFDLGFERAGFEVIWQCEKDDFCRSILDKHWPDVPVFPDVRELYTGGGPCPERPDVLVGGFPCQDLSLAGKGAGLDGERSGLWWEYHRIIGVVRPRYVVVENVPALVHRGLPAVLGALSALGYDAEWEVLSACAFGAPHTRERLFLVAYPHGERQLQPQGVFADERRRISDSSAPPRGRTWTAEPRLDRVADGVPRRLDRDRALGNAIVPQVAEYVARLVDRHAANHHPEP